MKLLFVLLISTMLATVASGQLTLKQVQKAFDGAKIPMLEMTVFDSKTDPNKMIGRPSGYLEKASWLDGRLPEKESQNECTVEVFKTAAQAAKRKAYLDAATNGVPFLIQYSYLRKNVLVRIAKDLDPAYAAEYAAALKKL